jgi:hypothetical protein
VATAHLRLRTDGILYSVFFEKIARHRDKPVPAVGTVPTDLDGIKSIQQVAGHLELIIEKMPETSRTNEAEREQMRGRCAKSRLKLQAEQALYPLIDTG